MVPPKKKCSTGWCETNPTDGTGYQYFKYYLMVKYLLKDEELVTIEEFFNMDMNQMHIEGRVFEHLP